MLLDLWLFFCRKLLRWAAGDSAAGLLRFAKKSLPGGDCVQAEMEKKCFLALQVLKAVPSRLGRFHRFRRRGRVKSRRINS